MASKTVRKQILIVALYETLVGILYYQSDFRIQREIEELKDDAIKACNVCSRRILIEGAEKKDFDKISVLKNKFIDLGYHELEVDTWLSLCICLITDQIVTLKNRFKKIAFEKLLHTAENLLWYFDPAGVSQDKDGFDAAQIMEKLTS